MLSTRIVAVFFAALVFAAAPLTGPAYADNSEVMGGQGGGFANANNANNAAPQGFECPAGWDCKPKPPPPGFQCPAGWSCAPRGAQMPAAPQQQQYKSTYEEKVSKCTSRFSRCYRQLYGDGGDGGD